MTRLTQPRSHQSADLSDHPSGHRTPVREPDEDDGVPMPIEPDEGPVPARIPDDSEHDRVIDPED